MDISLIKKIYLELIEGWNNQDAQKMSSLFAEESNMVGFDGSQINGKKQIEIELSQIFSHHKTAPFISKIKEIRFLSDSVALLCANVGMIPLGKKDIDPALNAIQSMVAVKSKQNKWEIALFQNTPAQFHGRPQLTQEFSKELRELLK